jgi:hypothetical protein
MAVGKNVGPELFGATRAMFACPHTATTMPSYTVVAWVTIRDTSSPTANFSTLLPTGVYRACVVTNTKGVPEPPVFGLATAKAVWGAYPGSGSVPEGFFSTCTTAVPRVASMLGNAIGLAS